MSDCEQKARCAAIVLAAGASTRLGQPKQLLRLDGESLLRRTVRLAFEAGCSPVFAVLGFNAQRMQQELLVSGAKVVVNPNWRSGMGSSLRCGISALMAEDPVPPKTMLLVCDQARLSGESLSELIRVNAQGRSLITASRYASRLGVPAIFDKQLYADLLKVEGDQGARSVIQRYLDQTTTVEFHDGIIDIDTPDDLIDLGVNS
ncbi:nucleotidyltransferase family protein [Alloacidobacterium dinghuense]|uniref:Nucleotidyltransferase family protein n=1 Tax=Alloacidobacterium dinghuense TaxID=2763107 RepID=A0A7G8BHN8_9BACT|nr:nucleotidyltransferase family protein [Alloacidobacterium dinghuense]QNI32058.1 nucleotidyltransferase family protein [Alloacidobacterium dinghuense]